jgi:uncharacterized protein (TIGR02145 family)
MLATYSHKIKLSTIGVVVVSTLVSTGLFALVFVFISFLPQPQPATATPLVDSVPTISLTAPTTATLNVTPNNSSPTTASSTISVTTNNTTGYSISATTQDSTNDCLKSSADAAIDCPDATNKIINTAGTSISPVTELATNTWGISLDNGTTWQGIPLLGQPALSIKSTNAPATNDNSTITYGVKVDNSLPADTYSGTVIITAMANVVPAPTITTVANLDNSTSNPATGTIDGGDTITITGTGFDSAHTVTIGGNNCGSADIVSSTEITCITPASTLTGDKSGSVDVTITNWGNTVTAINGFTYVVPILPPTISGVSPTSGVVTGGTSLVITGTNFTSVNAVTVGGTNCTSYTVNSATQITCITPAKAAGTYAVAVTTAKGTATRNSAFTYTEVPFSSFNSTSCNNMSSLAIMNLLDTRNGQVYRVRKMQDSKCWMIDNLKYLPTTNYPNGQQIARVASGNYMTVNGSNTQSTANSDKAFYADPGNTSYGYLYNWYAATNGTGTYALSSGEASSSICPANFRLPTGGNTGEFAYLNAYMAGVTPPSTSNSYYAGWQPAGSWRGVFSGYWGNGPYSQSSYGAFWSSTADSSSVAYGMYFGSGYVLPAYSDDKYRGFAVRCVAS